jgi:hypothetical protein
MSSGDKNVKVVQQDSVGAIKDTFSKDSLDLPIQELAMSYTKTNKLITALYMVTDIIDKDEPIRHKLRTLGSGIISDIHSSPVSACNKIYEILSFLEIAFAINIISEMNCNILRKEFTELNRSVKESTDKVQTINRQINLSDFFREDSAGISSPVNALQSLGHSSIGHWTPTRIGVQKGSTLMKALSDKVSIMSHTETSALYSAHSISGRSHFELLKKERRESILKIIKVIGQGATIKNIRDKVREIPAQSGQLASCSEKTLQRELVSMIEGGVLYKEGSKRWSKYFIKN